MGRDHQVPLRLGDGAAAGTADLSAVSSDGSLLWIAGDEEPVLHRLTRQADGSYGEVRTFRLDELVPGLERGEEIDVEGMDLRAGELWLAGSHSRTRRAPEPDDDDRTVPQKLATEREHPNREVVLELRAALATDERLAPFLPLPGKDGGLDVEGLAAVDDAVLLGLRGPVLRGWAVVLEVRPRTDPEDPGRLRLDADDGAGYRSIVLDLDGLGVRDLCRVGDDVLLLAGPTMALDGPFRLHRWTGAAADRRRVVRSADLPRLAELPSGRGADEGLDHPEGLTPLAGVPDAVLVVHDSPAPGRLPDPGTVLADVLSVPRHGPPSVSSRPAMPAGRPNAGEVPCPSAR